MISATCTLGEKGSRKWIKNYAVALAVPRRQKEDVHR